VVLYSRMYLVRLWTVYEMATWALVKDFRNMIIIPEFLPWCIFVYLFAPYLGNVVVILLKLRYLGNVVVILSEVLCMQAGWYVCHRFVRQQVLNDKQIAKFDIKQCMCFDESDRIVVEKNIALMMRAMDIVPETCDDAEAMKFFNMAVRMRLPRAVQESLGSFLGFSYWHLLACSLIRSLVPVLFVNVPNVIANWDSCKRGSCYDLEFDAFIVLWSLAEPIRLGFSIQWCKCVSKRSRIHTFVALQSYFLILGITIWFIFSFYLHVGAEWIGQGTMFLCGLLVCANVWMYMRSSRL